ncbi:DUF3750 domain-containing protein [Polaromonas sp. YR568]|uniref:DUF3750 domain-containing protein n=1 Tax=Polaromonas sp. YR568 TaxID=1855301 RepID=UPI0031378DBC
MKPPSRWLGASLVAPLLAPLVLVAHAALAQDHAVNTAATSTDTPRRSWITAPRYSAGIAPDPVQEADRAIVQVYAAATYGWRGNFAVHPWIIYKRKGETSYTRYDVVGWRAPNVVQRDYAVPDGYWYGSTPELLVDHRGEGVEPMIDAVEAAIASYPYARQYRSYPGPNSNTFLAHIGREVPALKLDLPANAIGKDYRPLTNPIGISTSGSGLQFSLLGLLGVSLGVQEGLEFNVLGLNFGVDFNSPALRLPFWGRLGFSDLAAPAASAETTSAQTHASTNHGADASATAENK